MTEGQDQLRAAQERFDRAQNAVSDHTERAIIVGSEVEPPLDEELDRLEGERNGAIADVRAAGRLVIAERPRGE